MNHPFFGRRVAYHLLLGFVCLIICPVALADDQTYDLSLHAQPGQKWEGTARLGVRIKSMDGPLGRMATPGITEDSRKYTVTVLEVEDGKWKKLDFAFDDCQLKNQAPGTQIAQFLANPLSHKHLVISRAFDPATQEAKVDIDSQDVALPVEIEDDLKAVWSSDLLPTTPLRVGQPWSSKNVSVLFGADNKGRYTCTLDHIVTLPSRQKVAVVKIKGSTTHSAGMRVQPGGRHEHEADMTTDLTMTSQFSGTINVDLATGIIELISLNGPVELEQGASLGQAVHQHGEIIYDIRSKPVASAGDEAANTDPDKPGAQPGANHRADPDNPLAPPPPSPFIGKFKSDKLSIEFRLDNGNLAGAVTMGAKQYPLEAKADGNNMTGTFDSNGKSFDFTATLLGSQLNFETNGKVFPLKREEAAVAPAANHSGGDTANPLDTPASNPALTNPPARNPLDQ
jgi:hypothetical protein